MNNRRRTQVALLLIVSLLARHAPAQTASVPDEFAFAAVGDIIYQRPALSVVERGATTVVEKLRGADVAFGNFESNGFALQGFSGAPQSKIEGPTLLTPPQALLELKSMGFDLLSHANNHVFDWGAEGVLASNAALKQAGLMYAGSGDSLRAARAPAVFSARNVRVALIAATSTFPSAAMAADGWGAVAARPGVNGVNLQRTVLVSTDDLEAVRNLSRHEPPASVPLPPPAAGEVRLLGQTFRADKSIAGTMGFSYRIDEKDRKALVADITAARAGNHVLLFSLHTHEPGNEETAPPDFEVTLAHDAIDAGADAVLAHGAHQLRGIEIYKGKPIFYSLANFSIMLPPAEANVGEFKIPPNSLFTRRSFAESVVAVGRFRGGKLAQIELHPFELSATNHPATHGLPQAVSAQGAQAIVARLQALSAPFGTRISFERGIGVINIAGK